MNRPAPTLLATMEKRVRRPFIRVEVMVESMPVAIMAVPNIIAQRTNAIVGSIPVMPPVLTRLSNVANPVLNSTGFQSKLVTMGTLPPPSISTMPGWKRKMPAKPSMELIKRVNWVLTRITIKIMVMSGISRVHGVITKCSSRAAVITPDSIAASGLMFSPAIKKQIKAIIMAGAVVNMR